MAKPIEFKAGTLSAMSALLQEVDIVRLADALQVMMGGMGEFFAGEPTIVDVSAVRAFPDRVDWTGVLSLLRRYGLQPVALRGAPEHFHDAARRAGLAILDDTIQIQPSKRKNEPKAAPAAPAPARAEPAPAPAAPAPIAQGTAPANRTMVVDRTIRSGVQIYARGCDLIVLGAVSFGAEVMADGSIHCYGPLRGRAIAGAQGDHEARIYCSNFGPELISIAGVYRTFENGIPEAIAGKSAQVLLRGEQDKQSLVLEPLQLN